MRHSASLPPETSHSVTVSAARLALPRVWRSSVCTSVSALTFLIPFLSFKITCRALALMSTGGVDLLLMKVSCCLSRVLEARSRNRTATAMSPTSIAVPVGSFSPFSLHVLKIAVPVWGTAITANSGPEYGVNTRACAWQKPRWWAHPKAMLVLKSIHKLDQPPCTPISMGAFVLLQNLI